jgi:predicted MFS family arabinose efflux permease
VRPAKGASLTTVIVASAAGTAFEWYDFFVFVPLAGVIAKTFSAGLSDTAALVFALGSFAVGFAFRPVGALIFGRIGDRAGRKGAFLITVSLMGAATFLIGCLPSYAKAGVISPVLFLLLRMCQGVALGGEYGGAAIYVAEHAPAGRRGFYTSFIQTSAAIGLTAALLVTLATRTAVGETAFAAWGWRVPFLASAGLLAVSLWIRLKLAESPSFKALAAEGKVSRAPYREAFGRWSNLKRVLIALFALMVAQGSVWYCAFFYAQVFIERVVHVAPATVNAVMIAVVIASAPLYVLFGWLSDRLGRKWVMTLGTLLATAALFPGFHALARFGAPALVRATAAAPVTVAADPRACSVQFDPLGKASFRTACDIAKSALTTAGVSYVNVALPPGSPAEVRVGGRTVAVPDGSALDKAGLARTKAAASARIGAALKAAGYPPGATAQNSDAVGLFLVLLLFAVGATALYGPQAACLVELFPTRVRYTALSLPYHLGTGWVGGFLPATAYAMVVSSGNIYFGLWYPVIGGAIAVASAVLFLPETRGADLDA